MLSFTDFFCMTKSQCHIESEIILRIVINDFPDSITLNSVNFKWKHWNYYIEFSVNVSSFSVINIILNILHFKR